MKIIFLNARHEALANDQIMLAKKFDRKGMITSIDIIATLDVLKAADSLADIPPSFRPHPLHGKRKGEFAVNVTKKERTIFRPSQSEGHEYRIDNPTTITEIEIVELCVDYH